MKSRYLLITLPGLLLALSAMANGNHAGGHGGVEEIGKPGLAAQVTRTVPVDMTDDMRFHTSKIAVKQGETIRFVVATGVFSTWLSAVAMGPPLDTSSTLPW